MPRQRRGPLRASPVRSRLDYRGSPCASASAPSPACSACRVRWPRRSTDMRDIIESTNDFESWMKRRADISNRLLARKHDKMADGAFPFLRATFYRWAEQWPKVCRRLDKRADDVLLAVGDLHVENFGVWRDSRGQHVWGVNDFDEACELPFTSDIVRLATSVLLAAEQQHVK